MKRAGTRNTFFYLALRAKRGEHDAIRNQISNNFDKRRISQPKTQ